MYLLRWNPSPVRCMNICIECNNSHALPYICNTSLSLNDVNTTLNNKIYKKKKDLYKKQRFIQKTSLCMLAVLGWGCLRMACLYRWIRHIVARHSESPGNNCSLFQQWFSIRQWWMLLVIGFYKELSFDRCDSTGLIVVWLLQTINFNNSLHVRLQSNLYVPSTGISSSNSTSICDMWI